MIKPHASFQENLQHLPTIDGVLRIELTNAEGECIATIENQQGKKGSLAVYQYLQQEFGTLDAAAASHGVAIFAEHSADAEARPGAHPNIDRLFDIINGSESLNIRVIAA